jgi:hypothetical protein
MAIDGMELNLLSYGISLEYLQFHNIFLYLSLMNMSHFYPTVKNLRFSDIPVAIKLHVTWKRLPKMSLVVHHSSWPLLSVYVSSLSVPN